MCIKLKNSEACRNKGKHSELPEHYECLSDNAASDKSYRMTRDPPRGFLQHGGLASGGDLAVDVVMGRELEGSVASTMCKSVEQIGSNKIT